MRRLIFSLLLLAIGFAVLVSPLRAQEKLEFQVKEEATESVEKAEYILPWPGILPDHPLYKLKMLRDKIWGFLIRDPLKKSQWSLLMADKRIWASQLLAEKDKFNLAVETATKAEKYLEQAVTRLYEAKKMGKTDQGFSERLIKASLKHEEVLGELLKIIPEDSRSVIKDSLKYPQDASEKVLKLLEE